MYNTISVTDKVKRSLLRNIFLIILKKYARYFIFVSNIVAVIFAWKIKAWVEEKKNKFPVRVNERKENLRMISNNTETRPIEHRIGWRKTLSEKVILCKEAWMCLSLSNLYEIFSWFLACISRTLLASLFFHGRESRAIQDYVNANLFLVRLRVFSTSSTRLSYWFDTFCRRQNFVPRLSIPFMEISICWANFFDRNVFRRVHCRMRAVDSHTSDQLFTYGFPYCARWWAL
jgi:hypothetical protein